MVRCIWCGAGPDECPGARLEACTMQGPPKPKVGLAAFWSKPCGVCGGRHVPIGTYRGMPVLSCDQVPANVDGYIT